MSYKTTMNVAWQRESTKVIVYLKDYEQQEFIIFENVSKDIWMGIMKNLSIEDICLKICEDYEISESGTIRTDVESFIQDCMENNWIEES